MEDGGVLLKSPLRDIGPHIGPYLAILEHGCRMIYAGVLSFFGLGLEDGHVPTFRLLL